jgi:hypothetical protein
MRCAYMNFSAHSQQLAVLRKHRDIEQGEKLKHQMKLNTPPSNIWVPSAGVVARASVGLSEFRSLLWLRDFSLVQIAPDAVWGTSMLLFFLQG